MCSEAAHCGTHTTKRDREIAHTLWQRPQPKSEHLWFIKFDGDEYGPYETERKAMRFAIDATHRLGESGEQAQVLSMDESGTLGWRGRKDRTRTCSVDRHALNEHRRTPESVMLISRRDKNHIVEFEHGRRRRIWPGDLATTLR